ncbi:hypothetical protein [Streptomyces sp. NPDC019937]|uniref:hypothetical protein n=1 Tax=Streptomyces sp. NPDC019937 TaxID=3154787 RepID=UPI0033DF3FC3
MTDTTTVRELATAIRQAQENGQRTPLALALAIESARLAVTPQVTAELEFLRKDRDAFRAQRNGVFKTNERLIGSLQEEQDARLRAENDVRTLTRERDGLRTRFADSVATVARLEQLRVEREKVENALRARVAELEAEQGNNDRAKAPWGRAEDGRPYLPEGADWTDVPELVDRTVAGIQARVDQAQPGHWYTAPATETGLAPGMVRTRVDGYPRTVGQFTNVLPADLELILHAYVDLSWCLEMLAKFRARVAELLAERHSTNAALVDVTVAMRAAESGQAPGGYPPAFPWARWLDAEDRADFLDELAAAAIANVGGAEVLAEVEETCARWRVIAEATQAHLTAPGPNCTCQEPVADCTGVSCGCPVCHRAVAVPDAELDGAAPSQVLPLAVDVPVPVVLTEDDGPAVVTSSARQSAARLRMLLHPLDPGVRP